MGFNNEIQTERPNIAAINSSMIKGDYFVDRTFQRRLVWTDKQKVRLIETVIMDYPMPEIYVWDQVPDDEGNQSFSIVDGQQRLTAIRQYISNEWPLKTGYLNEENRDSSFANLQWKDLDQKIKQKIFQYNINTRRIPSSTTKDEIRAIFARLNETDRSLNPQEIRHARMNGLFLRASEILANKPEMTDLALFSTSRIRRMADVEFASQLLGFERNGITNDTASSLNTLYDTYTNEYDEKEADMKSVIGTLKIIKLLFQNEHIVSVFGSPNNVYTLHALLYAEEKDCSKWLRPLSEFSQEYTRIPSTITDENKIDANLLLFRRGASSRTRSKSSRMDRLNGLRNWLSDWKAGEAG